jgi:hypothetical protein
MTPKPISSDLAAALHAAGKEPLSLIDEATQHVYVLVDIDIHERAMKALHHLENVESIRRGVADMDAGRGISITESQQRTLEALARHAAQ